jgi:hypothetical protein
MIFDSGGMGWVPGTARRSPRSENNIRCQVTRRKVSAGTRSDIGRDRRDAFLRLAKACAIEIAFCDPLVWSGISGRSSTLNNLGLLALSRASSRSSDIGGQGAFTDVGERLGVDDVIVVAGAQQREEVEAALGGCCAEPGEVPI